MRHLGHALVGHHAPPERLKRLVTVVEHLADELDTGGERFRPGDDMTNDNQPSNDQPGDIMTSFPDRPVSGAASPWGVDLEVTRETDGVTGRCTLRSAHEGAPARAHGGVVAAIFDDLFGFVLHAGDSRAFTGELTVRYLKGTPLHVPLIYRARLVSREGRKLFMEAECFHDDVKLATAKAVFITIESFTRPAG